MTETMHRPEADSAPDWMRVQRMLIRDAINGAARARARPDLFVYPLIDYLHLWIQQPACVTFWKSEGNRDRPIFFSFLDPQVLTPAVLENGPNGSVTKVQVFGTPDYKVTVHLVARDNPVLVFDKDWTNRLPELWTPRHDDPIGVEFEFIMHDALVFLAGRSKGRMSLEGASSNVADLSHDDVLADARTRIAAAIDRVFSTLRDSLLLHIGSSQKRCFNLFTVVRWVQSPTCRYNGLFPYTAAIQLTPTQETEIASLLQDRCNNGDTEAKAFLSNYPDWARLIQHPLGTEDRAVFDSIVASGFLEVGQSGQRGEAATGWRDRTATNSHRQEAESFVYKQLIRELVSGTDGDEEPNVVLLYVPVHVGGSPWLCFFTFAFAGKDGWLQHYHLYRDVFSPVNDRLRREIETVFLEMTGEAFKGFLSSGDLQGINNRLKLIAQIFPYEQLRLDTTGTTQAAITLAGRAPLYVEKVANPFHPQHVEYELIMLDSITRDFRRLADEYGASKARLNAELAENVYAIGHPLKHRLGHFKGSYHTLVNEAKVGRTKDERARISERAKTLAERLKAATNTARCMDMMAELCRREGRAWDIDSSKEFLVQKPYPLWDCLQKLVGAIEPNLDLSYDEACSLRHASIDCTIPTTPVASRLFDPFFDDMLYELLNNAEIKAPETDRALRIALTRVRDTESSRAETLCLEFANSTREFEFTQRLGLVPDKWCKWDTGPNGPKGGLRLIAVVLHAANCGDIWARPENRDGNWTFRIAIGLPIRIDTSKESSS